MIHNPVIDQMMQRKSIRKYTPEMPPDEVIETLVQAGQQAPFAYQLGSLLLRRDARKNPFHAPLLFIVCVDAHRFERIMAKRGWEMASNDLSLMVIGIQDAALMAENMVMAAESLGLGSCFLGALPYQSKQVIEEFKLPPRVFPLVGLTIGYPAENPPPRPRYPLGFTLFEGEYPAFDDQVLEQAMQVMDEGYLAQDYYRKANYIIPPGDAHPETFTFETYSWTEHISRKLGLWQRSPRTILAAFKRCGFRMPGNR